MADSIIPNDIERFILQHIDSVAELEGLLMFRAHPQQEWSTKAMARELYVDEAQAMALLAHLLEQGFLIAINKDKTLMHYQYRPQSRELANMVNRIADLYRQYLVPVTAIIHSKSKTKIREFANAFRIRKD